MLAVTASGTPTQAQASGESDYKAKRNKAIELFKQDKHIEALPFFEDLAQQNAKDDFVLLGLATCLVSHAATIEDEAAAAKERIRARELLLNAKELGNDSSLLHNLLEMLPPDGAIPYANTPAEQAMKSAEAAFAKRDFEAAIKSYSKTLELDPKNYHAALFIGDSYFAQKDFLKAADWYAKAIQINPNVETAYRYSADMFTRNGEMEKARTMAIEAIIAEPYNPVTWRGLEQWAKANHLQLNKVHLNAPNNVSQQDGKNITISMGAGPVSDSSTTWLAYSLSRAAWRGEKFEKQFPNEKQYRHSLAEESEALSMAANVLTGLTKKKKSAAPADADMATLTKLHSAKLLEPYVLLSAADEGIAQDYAPYREKNRTKLTQYLSEFIVPPLAPK